MCQPGAADAPGRLPRRVLALLRRLPEREVARVLLARVRLLLLDLVGPLARRGRRSPRSGRRGSRRRRPTAYACPRGEQLLDQRDDLRHRLGRERLRVRHPEAEAVGVLEVPARRLERPLGAVPGRGLVDLVVDVRDVVDERDLVAALPQPAREPHEDHERPRVADVRALVDGRAADVDPDRLGRRRQLDERAASACPAGACRDRRQPAGGGGSRRRLGARLQPDPCARARPTRASASSTGSAASDRPELRPSRLAR